VSQNGRQYRSHPVITGTGFNYRCSLWPEPERISILLEIKNRKFAQKESDQVRKRKPFAQYLHTISVNNHIIQYNRY
jgi:hypothetical protein